jgi:hypothetical protein
MSIQGGTFEGSGAVIRSVDRERYERDQEALYQEQHPVLKDPQTEHWKLEQAAKAAKAKLEQLVEEANAMARGDMKIASDGTKVRKNIRTGRWEVA